jgi:hypothetical protein
VHGHSGHGLVGEDRAVENFGAYSATYAPLSAAISAIAILLGVHPNAEIEHQIALRLEGRRRIAAGATRRGHGRHDRRREGTNCGRSR